MKKLLLIVVLFLASIGFFPTEAKANNSQVRIQIGRQDRYPQRRNERYRGHRRTEVRPYYYTRIVRRGLFTYRETYVVSYRFGNRQERLVSRQRLDYRYNY